MTPLHQNADCRVQDARWRVGGWWGVPTWGLTRETVWCQKSVAGRAGNHDRRQSQDGISASTTDNGAKVIRPGAGRKPVFSHSFGASASPGFLDSPCPGTVCAALFSSTPSVSCGGFSPGLSARVVVWFIGVEDSLSVVVPPSPFDGVRDVATDAPGVGVAPDAGRYVFRGPAGSAGSGACKSRNTDAASVSGGENPSTPDNSKSCVCWALRIRDETACIGPRAGAIDVWISVVRIHGSDANFPGSRPGLKGTTWRKSRSNKRSRTCRECRQHQPSLWSLASPSRKPNGPVTRSIRGRQCTTAIRSSFPASRPRLSFRRLPLLESVTGSRAVLLMPRRAACRVVGCGGWRVGESTGLPRREAWGALSGHTGQRSLGLCWRDRQGRSVTRRPAILKNKTDVGQSWDGAPTVEPGNRGADAIESLSVNQGSRSERNASDVADAYRVRTGLNVPMKDTALS